MKKNTYHLKGFTLIETLVGIAIFMIIAISVYQVFAVVTQAITHSRIKVLVTALANEQFEIIRNLPYDDVGVVGGIPNGKIPQIQSFLRDGGEFFVETTVRNIDDPFDDLFPDDLSPADYKLVEVNISCPACRNFRALRFTTHVAPRGLETASDNGAIFVHVFNAAGLPVTGANVYIENNQEAPPISFNDTTDNDGWLKIVDVPPGVEAYEIIVTKPSYSTDKTYPAGIPENPNPTKPQATVAIQQLTQISFAIDKTSTLNVESINQLCEAVPSVDFTLSGSKLIGTGPDVLKHSASYVTSDVGGETISDLEWDTYYLALTDIDFDLAGTIPLLPLVLNPNTDQSLKLVAIPKNPQGLMVTAKDASTQLPLSETLVQLEGPDDYDETLVTGRGFINQTDWSGGAGQENFTDLTKYFDSDENVEISSPAGEIRLKKFFDEYFSSTHLISSTFDTGSESNFHQILWLPQSQPPETGTESVRFQVATNNDMTTWDFVGPDGTSGSYYTVANQNISSLHNGDRYLRYKIFLETEDLDWTPVVSDVSFTFTSECVPPGQVFFSGLDVGTYTLTVSKGGYYDFSGEIDILDPWQQQEIILSPSP